MFRDAGSVKSSAARTDTILSSDFRRNNSQPGLSRPSASERSVFQRWNDRRGKDADFPREYKKLTGEEPDPLMPEEMEKAIREMPRDAEVIELQKKFPPRSRFPRDNCEDCIWLRTAASVGFLQSFFQRLESAIDPARCMRQVDSRAKNKDLDLAVLALVRVEERGLLEYAGTTLEGHHA